VRINAAGRDLIKKYEGVSLKAYRCPAGVITIGWGHTGDVKPGDVITEHQAEAILDVDLDKFEKGVEKLLQGCIFNQYQFSALVSFAFNLGLEALGKSTLLAKFRAGDVKGAASEFMKWKYAAGKVLPGLVKRRAEEKALFLSGSNSPPSA
jgi:lysozyme